MLTNNNAASSSALASSAKLDPGTHVPAVADTETTLSKVGVVTGLFLERARAEDAYHLLSARGYNPLEVTILMSDDTRQRHFGHGAPQTELETELGNAGTSIGALIGVGSLEERIKRCEAAIRQGGILISVRPHSATDGAFLADEWSRLGADHVHL